MVVAAKKSRELEMSLESFFLGKWILEDNFPCIPSIHLHMPRLRSHSKKEVNRNTETEIPLVSNGKAPSTVEKNVKRRDIVFFISTPDKQIKSKCRRINREKSKSRKICGNSDTVNPSLVTGTLPSEPPIHCVKKTHVVHGDASPDGQIMNKGRGVERKINKSRIAESQLETRAGSLSSKRPLKILEDQNKENSNNEHSVQRSERKAAKKARICLKEISNNINDLSLVEVEVSETEPNKYRQGKIGKKVKDKPEKDTKYRQRYSEVSECEQESDVRLGKKENEPNTEEQVKSQGNKAITRMGRRYMGDSDDSRDETWMDHKEKEKKIAKKKLEKSNRKRPLTKDENRTKRASTKNKTSSEQKKMESQNNVQGPNKDVNSRKMKDKPKKTSTVKSKMKKTDDAAKACSQENLKENLNPEDCRVTAKKGTLRYLKQRERFLEVKAKEAQVDDDFFSNDMAFKKKVNLDLLLVPASLDDSFTIKTPQSKKAQVSDSVITPRTALLSKFGSVTPSSCTLTPSTSSPVSQSKAEDRKGALEVMYHQMKGTSRQRRGIRKNHQNNFVSSDSMLKKTQAPQLLELPDFVDYTTDGNSSHDEYFNSSDTI
ncbi:uncharacterized protein [Panulirus ornatus]|uniref:uncharacterized protein n=1 Tax=Panulirus ornatus TaxID=150431 RepID=UPI003A8C338F